MVVEFLDEFVEAEVEEGFARDLGVLFGEEANPFSGSRGLAWVVGKGSNGLDLHFVLEGFLEFLSSYEVFDSSLALTS